MIFNHCGMIFNHCGMIFNHWIEEVMPKCTKCGKTTKDNQQKYCGDGSNKDNEHDWQYNSESHETMTPTTAMNLGLIIDDSCYPWIAYKGPRFNPTVWFHCLTTLEFELLSRSPYRGQEVHEKTYNNRDIYRVPPPMERRGEM